MGQSASAKGLSYEDSYDCGYLTFGHFRMALAKTYNEELGRLYEKWYRDGELSDEDGKRYNELCNDDLDIFLFHSDCDGKFTPDECRKIYMAIKDLKMEMQGHNYGCMPSISELKNGAKVPYYNMLEQWKNIFKHCYRRRVNLYFS